MHPRLLEPVSLGKVRLRNRVVMAPMTRLRADEEGVPSLLAATYYGQRSSAGLIIGEATNISARASGFLGTPGIYTAAQVAAWQRVTDTVHARGGTMFLQLSHVGRLAHPSLHGGAPAMAPSALDFSAQVFTREGMVSAPSPRELLSREVPLIVEEYAHAAQNAMSAGFDGVEIHAGSGMLPMQFLHSKSNARIDDYGGSIARRARFLLDVVDACLAVTGPSRTGVRISPRTSYGDCADGNPEQTYTYLFQALRARALAYAHVIEGPSIETPYKALARKHLGHAVIAAGGFDGSFAEAALGAGIADAVAFGTLYLSNPDLVERFARGWPANARPDPTAWYGGGEATYVGFLPHPPGN